jgi:hypothetical protein
VKEETVYSIPCKPVNITANKTVATKPYKVPLLLPCIKEWWAYVTVTKSQNNRFIFSITHVFYINYIYKVSLIFYIL